MSIEQLQREFFTDPRWGEVEKMLLDRIEPLKDLTHDLDLKQPAEHVKAEVIARVIAYNTLCEFLNDTKIVKNKLTKIENPYR